MGFLLAEGPISDWVALVGVGLLLVSMIAGGSWWCSAIYVQLTALVAQFQQFNEHWERDRGDIWKELGEHDVRVAKLEAVSEISSQRKSPGTTRKKGEDGDS